MKNNNPLQWRRTLVPATSTLRDVVHNLSDTGMQIALVASDDGTLIGTITDGDIRRGLLRGLNLDSPAESIVHREAMVAPREMGREMVLQFMRANVINGLPVLDESRRIVGLHLLNELLVPKPRQNLMIIMAGGQGTRLRPHTEACPKPLLPVGDKPMLEHIVERAKAEGFRRFVVAVYYLGHMIEEYFGDGGRWEVQIDYLREKSPLGTAGAIGLLQPKPDLPVVVTNGDVLTDVHYGELIDFHSRHGAMATMAVRGHEWQHPFGVVRTRGVDIIGFEEKPIARTNINAGIYVLGPTALTALKKDEYCDMPQLFTRLQQSGERTIAYPMHEPWLDVGEIKDFDAANGKG